MFLKVKNHYTAYIQLAWIFLICNCYDFQTITALLHKYSALSFWDYATAAPYVVVDMNPKPTGDDSGLCKKDAIFFSMHKVSIDFLRERSTMELFSRRDEPQDWNVFSFYKPNSLLCLNQFHISLYYRVPCVKFNTKMVFYESWKNKLNAYFFKFIGGVQTPGILIVKKDILTQNAVPAGGGGGGAVFFVKENDHRFLKEAELREEAGTPAIVEAIRAGRKVIHE